MNLVNHVKHSHQVCSNLQSEISCKEIDEYIDSVIESITDANHIEYKAAFLSAFKLAQSPLTKRSLALLIASLTDDEDTNSIDLLINAFEDNRDDPFLGPSFLTAIGICAIKSMIAHAELTVRLQRLSASDHRSLLIEGAKQIGRAYGITQEQPLLMKLEKLLTTTNDTAVQSECRYQVALIQVTDALQASDFADLHQRLALAKVSFLRAERSEEQRIDASLFVILLDILLILTNTNNYSPSIVAEIESLNGKLTQLIAHLTSPYSYASNRMILIAIRIMEITEALTKVIQESVRANRWLNISAELVGLVGIIGIIKANQILSSIDNRLESALSNISNFIVIPYLGPVLTQAVGITRFEEAINLYTMHHGHDTIAITLQLLCKEVSSCSGNEVALSSELQSALLQLQGITNQSPHSFLRSINDAFTSGDIRGFLHQLSLTAPATRLDNPTLYGNDPNVDEAVRASLTAVTGRLGVYPKGKYIQFTRALESITQFAAYVRDSLPSYTKCKDDGGKGQGATEHDLQEDLFRWLRMKFGPDAVYEDQAVAGGETRCRRPIC